MLVDFALFAICFAIGLLALAVADVVQQFYSRLFKD